MRLIKHWAIAWAVVLSTVSWVQAQEPATTPQVNLYTLELDQPLELPICDENMYWYAEGDAPCMWFIHEENMQAKPVWALLSKVGAMIYPTQTQKAQNLPESITIGLDENGVLAYVMMSPKGIAVQDEFVKLVSGMLGEPAVLMYRNNAPSREPPPGDIPHEMWVQAEPGSVLAIWNTNYAWARYIGNYREFPDGYLEIGLKRITRNGQLPGW